MWIFGIILGKSRNRCSRSFQPLSWKSSICISKIILNKILNISLNFKCDMTTVKNQHFHFPKSMFQVFMKIKMKMLKPNGTRTITWSWIQNIKFDTVVWVQNHYKWNRNKNMTFDIVCFFFLLQLTKVRGLLSESNNKSVRCTVLYGKRNKKK